MEKATKVLIFFYCIAAILLIGMLYAAFGAYKQHITHNECKCINNATIVRGEITSEIEGSSLKNTKRYKYCAKINFEYKIGNKIYVSDRYSVSGLTRTFYKKAEAQEFLKKYPIGKKMKAYYHPSSPQEAFLINELEFDFCTYILLFNTFSFLIVGFCFLVEQDMDKGFGFIKRTGLCVWWFLVGFLCFGYYFIYAQSIATGVVYASVVYGILGCVGAYLLFSSPMFANSKEAKNIYELREN